MPCFLALTLLGFITEAVGRDAGPTVEANSGPVVPAKLYLYRMPPTVTSIATGTSPKILLNGVEVTALRPGEYSVVSLAPGNYRIETRKGGFLQGHSPLTGSIDVDAGKVYYLSKYGDVYPPPKDLSISNVSQGYFSHTTFYQALVLMPADVATQHISKIKYRKPNVEVIE